MNTNHAWTVRRSREIERQVSGQDTFDGAGVRLTRVLTQDLQHRLDPFLMLDAFRSDDPGDYIGGFPEHPHRGFETVTYMLAGRMLHRDSAGNEGLLGAGDVQWMTTASGVVHSEMPQQENGLMHGFQLWLNLPGRDKMKAPAYRDARADEIPTFTDSQGVVVKVIAGHSHGIHGAFQRAATEPFFLDIVLPAGARFAQTLPTGHNAFAYVYAGEATIGESSDPLAAGTMGILTNDPACDGVMLRASSPSRALLIAGAPLGEPIAQYGPFVMNSVTELRQAFRDYSSGRFGTMRDV